MAQTEVLTLIAQLAMGFTLAACAGLRAFLPPLAVGLAARAGLLDLSGRFEWLEATPTLIVLSVAVVLELLGDKIPLVDHILDVSGTVVRPAAGALVALVPVFGILQAPWAGGSDQSALAWVLGLAAAGTGAGASAGVHLLKTQVRLGSTAMTAGLANPFLSILEDIVGIIGVALAILVPLLAVGLVILLASLALSMMKRRRARSLRA